MELLENIPVDLDVGEVKRRLRLKSDEQSEQVRALIDVAVPFISARAAYKVAYIDEKGDDGVTINGVDLRSRVLRKNLEKVGRVFPYVVTLGDELEAKIAEYPDMLAKYFLDTIANVALSKARKHLEDGLRSKFALGGMSFMSPGSLQNWPIEQQRPLFAIIGDVEATIGVRLSESLLMLPRKSVSGLYFSTEISFQSCQLCPRERCEGRRARYDEGMAREYGLIE
jgi:hypothetical protein